MAGGARAGRGEGGKRRAERRPLIANAKHDGFARLGGDRERAERPVPEGERKAEVLVEMSGIGGVMQLVMGGTMQDATGDSGEGDPHVGVPQVTVGQEKRHREDIAVQQGEGAHARAKRVGHDAECRARGQTDQIDHDDDLDRVLPQFGEGGQHLRGMVDLVKFPQGRNLVKAIVGQPVAEFISQQLERGRHGHDCPHRPMGRSMRAKDADQRAVDPVAPEEKPQAEQTIGGSENDSVQRPQAQVDERGRMQDDAPGEYRADKTTRADAARAGLSTADVIEGREQKRAAERRRAVGRVRTEGIEDGALKRRPDRVKAEHARLSSWSGASIKVAAFRWS